jgi:adenylate cyclase
MGSESTVVRLALARQAEEEVLAQSALQGERTISVVRLAIHLLRGGAVAAALLWAPATLVPPAGVDWLRVGVSVAYLLYAVGTCVGVFRANKPTVARSMLYPTLMNLADFGFNVFMAVRAFQMGEPGHPERGALSVAMFQCFSLARYGWRQVVQSTFLACASYLILFRVEGVPGGWPSLTFVEANLIGLGILIWLTNARIQRMFTDLRKRDNLQRFLPAPVVQRLLSGGEASLLPVQREVTVLFVDIRDFTALSEPLPPREVLKFLDDFFGHFSQVIKGRDGIVNKFLGDGMLAFWGVPEGDPEHAKKALTTVLDLRKELVDLNAQRSRQGQTPIRIGMGVHSGTVAAGMLGGADQHEYTIIGDAVNVASRVEGLTKTYAVDALVSEATWRLAGASFRGDRVGEDKVKGRREAVVVYALRERVPPETSRA